MKFFAAVTLLAFSLPARAQDACNGVYTDQKSCDANSTCTWCKCAAVPSACFEKENAKRLPPGVYVCDSTDEVESFVPEFEAFKKRFGKKYASAEEEAARFSVFQSEMKRIQKLNTLNGEPVFGVTFTSDLRPSERHKRGRAGHGDKSKVAKKPVRSPRSSVPGFLDWREQGMVTPVKNQGQCGSCWAFSTAETVESAYLMAGNPAQELSPQQIASCVVTMDGCGGGDTATAFDYLETVPGLANRYFWPYAQGVTPSGECLSKSCTAKCNKNLTQLETDQFYIGPTVSVTGYEYATEPCVGACNQQNLTKLAASLAEAGPASICVNAGVWDSYTGGVLTSAACGAYGYDDLDHCVQLVGFNARAKKPYWIVRNSWDTQWGEQGYIYLEYSKNTCGLANEAILAQVE